jgi:hypothetical protein
MLLLFLVVTKACPSRVVVRLSFIKEQKVQDQGGQAAVCCVGLNSDSRYMV